MEKLPKAEYRPEFREQAVRTYQESGLSVAEVAKWLSLPESSLNNWVLAAQKGKLASVGKNQRAVSKLKMELSRLKRELAETKMGRDFLKNARRISRRGCGRISPDRIHATGLPVALMCRSLGVSECGFHAWWNRAPSRRSLENARLEVEILAAHQQMRESYSAKRLHSDLADHGVQVSPYRVRELRMSRKGNHWENEVSVKAHAQRALYRNYNAPMESFWGTLKNGLVHHCKFETRQQAGQAISEYI
ncbi:hypothetical protein ANRL3_02822 [Anaerolineae bacterium]|nr:hypothetical protein ANRL3_02822 [Anaerolineae bacterium]